MTSGGARARSGPPPDPGALRRKRDIGEWRLLPRSGRQGDAPAWPLTRPVARELAIWTEEWRRPQAIAWEELGMERQVALYVRALKAAEMPRAKSASRGLVMRMETALGLSTDGLRANRWHIVDDVTAVTAATGTDGAPAAARNRWKDLDLEVLEGGEHGG